MTKTEAALAQIARESKFLHEVVEDKSRTVEVILDTLGTDRLNLWQKTLGGESKALDARIAWAGWTRNAVEAALCAQSNELEGSASANTVPWLQLLSHVFEAEPLDPWLNGLEKLPFGKLLGGFIATARTALLERLNGQTSEPISLAAIADCEMLLAERLSQLFAPCLLAEFDLERPAAPAILAHFTDQTKQAFGESYYNAFMLRQQEEKLVVMLTKYPVAARLAAKQVLDWVEATAVLFERLSRDWIEIRNTLFNVPHWQAELVSVVGGLSDPHDGGKTVCILEFMDGRKLVYKPRSLAPETVWQNLLAALDPTFNALTANVIDKGHYGWMEYVAPAEDMAANALPSFYHSAGIVLALTRAFAVTDLHFQNVIAASGRLVPVDLETLGQPLARAAAQQYTKPDREISRDIISSSILSTLAVPVRFMFANGVNGDISALSDLRNRTVQKRICTAMGSDAMALTLSHEPISYQHMPHVIGNAVPVNRHTPDLLAGFAEGWRVLMAARERLLSDNGPLVQCGDWVVRYIYRPTDVYARLLARTMQPSNLRNGIDFSLSIESLYARIFTGSGCSDELAIVDTEASALHQCDIPRLVTLASCGPAPTLHNNVAENLFARSGLDVITERLASLTPGRLRIETRIIDAAIHAINHCNNPDMAVPVGSCSKTNFGSEEALAVAVELGRSVLDTAMQRPDGGIGWVGIYHREEHGGVVPGVFDESFYEGSVGIALFLSALYRITGDAEWKQAAIDALHNICVIARSPDTEQLSGIRSTAGMGGIGGLGYGLAVTGALLEDDTIALTATSVAAEIELSPIHGTSDLDLITGRVGAIPALLAASETAFQAFGELSGNICTLGHEIVESQGIGPLETGYGHGRPGGLATLASFAEFDPALHELLIAASNANSLAPESDHIGWCKGSIGSALGRFILHKRLKLPLGNCANDVEAVVTAAAARTDTLDQVCCGLFGGVDALLVVGETGRKSATAMALDLAAGVLDRAETQSGFRLLPNIRPGFSNPGFFQGISGIGYVLLRAARPGILPSVLTCELPA